MNQTMTHPFYKSSEMLNKYALIEPVDNIHLTKLECVTNNQ